MKRPSEIALLVYVAAYGWLGLTLSVINACFEEPQPEPPAVAVQMGPNDLPRSCQ